MGGGRKLSEEADLPGSIRAFVAYQVNVAILRFFGLECALWKILKYAPLRFDSNVPPQNRNKISLWHISQASFAAFKILI